MRFIRHFLLSLGIFLLLETTSFAAGISISPLKYELTISPGQSESTLVKVTNTTDTPVTLYTSKEDFVAGDDSGTPSFVKAKDRGNDNYILSSWVTIEDSNLTLAKGETREVRFTVSVPKNAEPGGHYGAVFFSPGSPDKAQVAVVQRIGALLLINVPGQVTIEGNLTSFDIGSLNASSKFLSGSNFSAFPIAFETMFRNEGNIHVKPKGKIELIDENGETLKNIGKESLATPAGVFIGEKLVDYLPVNDGLGNALPKSDRRFESIWEGFGYPVVNEDGTKGVKFKTLSEYYADKAAEKVQFLKFYESIHTRQVQKKITANLTLSYEGKDKVVKDFRSSKVFSVSYDEQYVGVNYTIVTVILFILLGIAYYIFVQVPKSRERLRKSILSEIEKGKNAHR